VAEEVDKAETAMPKIEKKPPSEELWSLRFGSEHRYGRNKRAKGLVSRVEQIKVKSSVWTLMLALAKSGIPMTMKTRAKWGRLKGVFVLVLWM
jgi:hypothetical protein